METKSHAFRKARTRSLIMLGALVEKSGLLTTFEISLGTDLQKDPDVKFQVAALYKGLTVLNEMAVSDDVHLPLWSNQGLHLLGGGK